MTNGNMPAESQTRNSYTDSDALAASAANTARQHTDVPHLYTHHHYCVQLYSQYKALNASDSPPTPAVSG